MTSPIQLFNQAFGYWFTHEVAAQHLATLVEVAQVRGRGDIAEKLLTAKNAGITKSDERCPVCNHPFNVRVKLSVTTVWCGHGPCRSYRANDGVDNAEDVSVSESYLARKLWHLADAGALRPN